MNQEQKVNEKVVKRGDKKTEDREKGQVGKVCEEKGEGRGRMEGGEGNRWCTVGAGLFIIALKQTENEALTSTTWQKHKSKSYLRQKLSHQCWCHAKDS